jgi:hypothetical protein
LNYLGEVATGENRHASLAHIGQELEAGPVSPWVFCLYSKLVAELARDPGGNVTGLFEDIARASSLRPHHEIVTLRSSDITKEWWDHFELLFDTDYQRPFKPKLPRRGDFGLCDQEIREGLAILESADPEWHDEVRSLIRLMVLAAPKSDETPDLFNGASTFFLWGACLLNANLRRSALLVVDLLVHESSHLLLFGVSADGALMTNSGDERYDSPLRSDKRPIDGIFHACFVTTRVHFAMERLTQSGRLSEANAMLARDRQQRNGQAARAALEVLDKHARPTELGAQTLETLRAYWAARPRD